MSNLSTFQRVCANLMIIGTIIGLICGLIHYFWLTILIEIATVVVAFWGVWQTHFVHHNRYEFWRWLNMSSSVLIGEMLGYITARFICLFVGLLFSLI